MDFWETFWATMWGALGGAVVAAFAAWLFSLDLRRREREDRKQEREQDRLDREAERDQARREREAELADERARREREREQDKQDRLAEKEEDRDHHYAFQRAERWSALATTIMRLHSADEDEQSKLLDEVLIADAGVAVIAKDADKRVYDVLWELFSWADFTEEHASHLAAVIIAFATRGNEDFAVTTLRRIADERESATLANN